MDIEQDICDLVAPQEIDIIRMLLDRGAITIDDIAASLQEKKKEYVIKRHKSKIYIDGQGRWRTYYTEPGKSSYRRKTVIKRTKDEVYSALYDLYTHKEDRFRKRLVTIEELKDEWIEYKRLHGISEATIIKYESDWKCHLKGTDIVKRPICTLNKHYLDEWAHKLIRENNMTRKDYINVSIRQHHPAESGTAEGSV